MTQEKFQKAKELNEIINFINMYLSSIKINGRCEKTIPNEVREEICYAIQKVKMRYEKKLEEL